MPDPDANAKVVSEALRKALAALDADPDQFASQAAGVMLLGGRSDQATTSEVPVLVMHQSDRYLEDLSGMLSAAGVPHIPVQGSLDKPVRLLQSIYETGITNIDEFVFIQSLLHTFAALHKQPPVTVEQPQDQRRVQQFVLLSGGQLGGLLTSLSQHQFVAEAAGQVMAAVVVRAAGEGGPGTLEFAALLVHPRLDEAAVVVGTLLSFMLQYWLADDSVHSVHAGNVALAPSVVPLITFAVKDSGGRQKERQALFAAGLDLQTLVHSVMDAVQLAARRSTAQLPRPASAVDTFELGRMPSVGEDMQLDAGAGAELDAVRERCFGVISATVQAYLMEGRSEPIEDFGPSTPLMDAGLDSLDMLKMASLLGDALGVALSSTIVFDYPTIESLADYMVDLMGPGVAAAPALGSQRRRGSSLLLWGDGRGDLSSLFERARRGSLANLVGGLLAYQPRESETGQSVRQSRRSGDFSRSQTMRGGPSRGLATLTSGIPAEYRRSSSMPPRRTTSLTREPLGLGIPSSHHRRTGSGSGPSDDDKLALRGRRARTGSFLHTLAHPDQPNPRPTRRSSFVRGSMVGIAIDGRRGSVLAATMPNAIPTLQDNRLLSGAVPTRFAGILQGVHEFDAALFGISSAEAAQMDAQQRLLLESCQEVAAATSAAAAATSASAPATSPPAKGQQRAEEVGTGVWIGISYNEYAQLSAAAAAHVSTYTATGGSLSVAAGRISYIYGLNGPSLAIDTACSSGLVAVGSAHNALMLGVSPSAWAGAVNLLLSPHTHAMYAVAGMLAPDGRCKTLDASANGYVRSEAVGMLTLRALSSLASSLGSPDAHSVLVLGSAVNQDGRSSSLTAPNGPSQQLLIKTALQSSHLPPNKVNMLQMHGTGTSLGDPIEMNAAMTALLARGVDIPISLSSAKSSTGHAEPAAGVVGLACATSALEAIKSPGILHLRALNPHVESNLAAQAVKSGAQMYAPRLAAGLPAMDTRVTSGVSSFAFQGTNAHVIMEVDSNAPLRSIYSTPAQPWQRRSFWFRPLSHALLRRHVSSSIAKSGNMGVQLQMRGVFSAPALAYVWDNLVDGMAVVSPAIALEAVYAAAALLNTSTAKPALSSIVVNSTPQLGGPSTQHGTWGY
ncbi:hypothetical protein WJX72_011727 [[Myrmecia] bisecta]|uniref:Polyketide synthase n=1 Tax=[Myrmecia] bisecta TaxID=41462 RepID=A0AAW1RA02_9CHLO